MALIPLTLTHADDVLQNALNCLSTARVEFRRLVNLQEDQEAQLQAMKNELQSLETQRGEKVLEDLLAGDGAQSLKLTSKAVAEKRAELETCEDVLSALSPRVEAAKRAILVAKAACFQAEADICTVNADERQARTDELLGELQKWEDCLYTPAPPPTNPLQFAGAGRQGGAVDVVTVPKPITQRLRNQAAFYSQCAESVLDQKPFSINLVTGEPLYPIPAWYQEV
jgi:hypothetical protein